jgi:hypothetical protein
MSVEQHEIDRFEGEGGLIHMSDGKDLKQSEVPDYKKTHPGVQIVGQGTAAPDNVTRKLTQGDE